MFEQRCEENVGVGYEVFGCSRQRDQPVQSMPAASKEEQGASHRSAVSRGEMGAVGDNARRVTG